MIIGSISELRLSHGVIHRLFIVRGNLVEHLVQRTRLSPIDIICSSMGKQAGGLGRRVQGVPVVTSS